VGAYASGDRGQSWQKFMTGLPNVPVHDLAIHPREAELVAATHGRAFWVVDIAPLQQLTKAVAAKPAHLFTPRPAFQWGDRPVSGESTGNMIFQAPSPTYGADIWYRVTKPVGPVRVLVQDANGDTLQTLTGMGQPGLHKVTWNFQGRPLQRPGLTGAALRDSILQSRRIRTALDSVEKAGTVPKPAIEMIRRNIEGGVQGMQAMARAFGFAGGGGGGGGGFGGGQPARWVDRPAEGPAAPAAGAGGRGGAGGGAGGAAAGMAAQMMGGLDQNELFNVMRAIGVMGGGGGGGFGGGGVPIAETGDYLVSITVDGQTMKQPLRVERRAGGASSGFPFELEEMMTAYEKWLRRQR
jgi:hypothetical protein